MKIDYRINNLKSYQQAHLMLYNSKNGNNFYQVFEEKTFVFNKQKSQTFICDDNQTLRVYTVISIFEAPYEGHLKLFRANK